MKLIARLPRATAPAFLGSIVSLGSQAVFAVFLLKLFDPSAVGLFSVVSQVAFSWSTLALAQSTVTLLADRTDPLAGARRAWRASLLRMAALAPLAGLAWLWTRTGDGAARVDFLAWIAAIALAQLSWSLAQSLALRTGPGSSIFLVRCLPPALAAVLAWACSTFLPHDEPTALLAAALTGYVVGALWLVPAASAQPPLAAEPGTASQPEGAARADDRSNRLKMAHSFFDLLGSTLIAVQWARLYGPTEAGYVLALLRVFGFIPALVHTAWAQAVLAHPQRQHPSSLLAGLLACAGIGFLGVLVEVALAMQWLSPAWNGLRGYLWPVAVWQMAAAVFAAFSHVPFRRGGARAYSWQCIAVDWLLIGSLLIAPFAAAAPVSWMMVVAAVMTAALLAQAWYFQRKDTRPSPAL